MGHFMMTIRGPDGSLIFKVLMVLFHACAVWAQGGMVGNCWSAAPQISERSISVEMAPRNMTMADGSTSWDLVTYVRWARPAEMKPTDMFTLRLNRFDGLMDEESVLTDPCLVHIEEIIVETEEHVFHNLSFGQFYELEIHLYRPVIQQKSMMGAMTAFETPQCAEATGDLNFCQHGVDVQHSGAPIDPKVDSSCRNISTGLLRVSLSWFPPMRVNGNIVLYSIEYGVMVIPAPDMVPAAPALMLNTLTVFPPNSNGSNQTEPPILVTELQGLDEGKLYYVKITPIVNSPSDGNNYPGNDVEFTFVTANRTDPTGETTEINLATPHCVTLGQTTLTPTYNESVPEDTSTPPTSTTAATTPARLPPSTMEPAHIALIVIFTFLIVTVIVAFVVITVRLARNGNTITALPPLSKIPTMCKKQKEGEKAKDLNMIEKGAKPVDKKPPKTVASKPTTTKS